MSINNTTIQNSGEINMSILNQTTPQVNRSEQAVKQIKMGAARGTNQLIRNWETSWDLIWNNPHATPEEVLAELGTDAAEAFEISTALIGLMSALLPTKLPDEWARIQAKVAAKPATTTHDDGTITID